MKLWMPNRLRSLRVVATMHRNTTGGGSDARNLTAILRRVIADLEGLNHETEQDFLRIGRKLGEFVQEAKGISSMLTELAEGITGEQGLRASEALQGALKRSSEMRSRADEGTRLLDTIHQEAARVKHTLSGFRTTVSTFHTLGVLTRIETARLGSAGADFGNLANDVKVLAGNIQTAVEINLDTALVLIPAIADAIHHIADIKAGQSNDLPSVISGVLAGISSFHEKQDGAHDSSVRLVERYDAISKAFGKVIFSIQFHDITRQQVEHVVEVLRRLCDEAEAESSGASRDRRGIAALLALQSLQLADAGEKFAASVASITDSLQDIATHVLEMADESRTLTGLSEDDKNSFFLQMEAGCTAILASLQHCAKADVAARASAGGLAGTIDRMRGSVGQFGGLEIHMQRMGMNAAIRAAYTGPAGDPLGVLAGSMQQLAFESRQRSESLADALGSMSAAATRLSDQGEPAPQREGSSEQGYLDGMRTAVAELHSSSERSFAQITQIIECGARLREDLSATRQSFSVGAIFADAVGRAREMLTETEGKIPPGLAGEEAGSGLADFAMHYTMQAQRDVHEGVAKTAAGKAPANVRCEPLLEHLAILDERGTILKVNDAWRRFGQENQLRSPNGGVGLNYLRLCDTAEGDGAGDARRIAKGIRDVLSGIIEEYRDGCSCDIPLERRWYQVHVTRLNGPEGARVAVAHGNIMHRKLADEEICGDQGAADVGGELREATVGVAVVTEAGDVEDLGDNVELF
jgi:hypothetical protein